MRSRLRVCLPHFVMLLIAIALYVAAMQIDTSGTNGGKRIGPDFWPKAVIIFMGALALYEVVKRAIFGSDFEATGLTEGLTTNPAGDPATETISKDTTTEYPRLLWAGLLLILGYVVAVDWLGFFVTTVAFLFTFTWVGGFRRHGWNALISLVGAFVMVVLFMRVAYISLPLGEGPFRSLSIALMSAIGVH
ncbi:MAG: tripartite tricarboxylate transporter TctB family protein [Rubrivivax sp.]|nr:tripartite tricarboxylate transporter TctB family protein [Rubrivivax sp.]MBK7260451.1 tripartite tricarboxylate transporter TctB family protein [Rubrivivax sp.]MBK8526127.1 tripartite tricarboxylate transporter TctB family protein [Rubrivivax sp.]